MPKVLAILALVATLVALGVMSDRRGSGADLTYIEPSDIHTLDPQRMSYMQDFRLSYALYETLVRWDLSSPAMRIVPAAARAWDVSADGLVYTFRLDPGGRWSNGDPVTAHDFVYSWRRAMLPDTAADYIALFQVIKGARAFLGVRQARLDEYAKRPDAQRTPEAALRLRRECEAAFDQIVGLRALDDLTLRVTLERPTPYFLDLCAFGAFSPVHAGTVEAWADVDPSTGMIRQRHGWTKPPYLVGNGPYVLTSWRFKRDLFLEKCPTYRDPELARSRTIRILCIEDQTNALLTFQSGAADLHIDLDVPYVGDLLDQRERGERDDLWSFTAFGTCFWSFNCTARLSDGRENPFHDARVRRAFARAVDKEAIVRTVRRSREKVAASLIPPGAFAGFASPLGPGFDPALAARELRDAGWIDRDGDGTLENEHGDTFPDVELLATPTGPHREVALALASMWEGALGVRCRIVVRETKVYRNTLRRRDYMLARGVWYGDYADPLTFLDLHRTDDGNNDRGFSDPAYDAMLARADQEPDAAARMALLSEAERYLAEAALPVIPLWHFDQYYLFRPPTRPDGSPNPGGLRGISTHPRLVQYLWALEVVGRTPPSGGASASGGTP